MFYWDNVRLPFSQQQDKVFRESLTSIYPDIAIYSENLDSTLSAEDTPTRLAADFYRQKYKSVHFDAIVILNGEKPEDLKPVVEPAKYSFDARAMKRFYIAGSQLPAGSEVLFRDQDVWQKYRRYSFSES